MSEEKTLHIELSEEEFEKLEEFKDREGLTWSGVLKEGTGIKYPGKDKYDIMLEKTRLETEAEKVKAEAEKKALESMASSLKKAMENLGAGVGKVMAKNREGNIHPKPITDEGENPTGQFKFDCPECGEEVRFESGEDTVKCSNCKELYNLAPTSGV